MSAKHTFSWARGIIKPLRRCDKDNRFFLNAVPETKYMGYLIITNFLVNMDSPAFSTI